jgi:hypothetical protein
VGLGLLRACRTCEPYRWNCLGCLQAVVDFSDYLCQLNRECLSDGNAGKAFQRLQHGEARGVIRTGRRSRCSIFARSFGYYLSMHWPGYANDFPGDGSMSNSSARRRCASKSSPPELPRKIGVEVARQPHLSWQEGEARRNLRVPPIPLRAQNGPFFIPQNLFWVTIASLLITNHN